MRFAGKTKRKWQTFAALLLAASCGMRASGQEQPEDGRVLFTFTGDLAARQWETVNDGVMGGRSVGRFRITEENLEFFGTLSLENNGGFASVRSRPVAMNLKEGDVLVARVRGDGRRYSLNLYVPRRLTAFSYRAEFDTKDGEWIEVKVPLDEMVATSFGRVVDMPLKPGEVNGLGILLGDKRQGPFKLAVDWIKVESALPSAVDSK